VKVGTRLLLLAVVATLSAVPAAWSAECCGDCDGDGMVRVTDLIQAVNLALTECPTSGECCGDCDGDGHVLITDIVQAVNLALGGCATPSVTVSPPPSPPPTASPTPTPSPTSTASQSATPSPTSTASQSVTASPTRTPSPTSAPSQTTTPSPTPTRSPTLTPSPTPTVVACPLTFRDDTLQAGIACGFIGRWNSQCGDDQLAGTFASDGDLIVAAVSDSAATFFFGGQVDSSTSATLLGWAMREDLSDLQLTSGSMQLADDRQTLIIDPTDAPFDIGACPFEQYVGTFVTTVSTSSARAAVAADMSETP
jgi:hypothetical protein